MLLLSSPEENYPKMDQLESFYFLKLIGPLPEQVLLIDCSLRDTSWRRIEEEEYFDKDPTSLGENRRRRIC